MKKLNVMSLFNGMSFGMMALETLGVEVGNYYASEIDKYANQATMALHPDTIMLGDVTKWREWSIDWSSIDLLIGGSPCQGFSFAGKQAGTKAILDGVEVLVTDRETYLDMKTKGAEFLSQSHLFWEYILCLDHVKLHNPDVKFLLENVKMKKELLDMVTGAIGVEPVCINSSLVSAQNRNRYYWTNIGKIEQPEDKGIVLNDIIERYCRDVNSDGWHKWWDEKKEFQIKKKYSAICNDGSTDKAITLTARQYASWNGNFVHVRSPCKFVGTKRIDFDLYRKLTVRENMRLQTVPEHHIDTLLNAGISNTQLYKMTGNGWTHSVITHIFSYLNK